jgi:glutathione S-transferase
MHYVEDPSLHADRVAELAPKSRHALSVMELRLTDSEWLVEHGCTIADYALYPYTRCADTVGFSMAEYPAIQRWLERVEAQPDFIPLYSEGAVEILTYAQYFGHEPTEA